MNPQTLAAIVDLLNEGGWNYSVFLKGYPAQLKIGMSSQQLVQTALGSSAVVERVQQVTTQQVLAEVEASLAYAGDSGAGPNEAAIQSERFRELLTTLLAETNAVATEAKKVEQFWLKEGHPAYPVFWDFAFLFTGSEEALVFIGSSSD